MASWRTLTDQQRCEVWIAGVDAEPSRVLVSTEVLFEAPNWTLDGRHLVLNGDGRLWLLDVTRPDGEPVPVAFEGLPPINNDHVLAPDGGSVYLSAADRHIYRGRLDGGPVERVTPEDGRWHFLHGVSPDGERLAYVEITAFDQPSRLAVLGADGTVSHVDVGPGHLDGPEWSPDGAWIHLNTEAFTTTPGHAQLARVSDDDGTVERLVASDTVDWFPHLSPDGRYATYVSFPVGTTGHPADLPVTVTLVATDNWTTPLQRIALFGGQGTLNVNSWAPDSRRFAYVAYPIDREGRTA